MARRMFSDEITISDAFLDMPNESQLLYFHLGMNADDDGFISNTKMIQRTIGASEDSLKILFAKKFLLSFESGIIVVKHWRVNNQIRKDRYRETKYLKEKSLLFIRENGAYTFNENGALPVPKGHFLPSGNQMATTRQPSIGKVRLGKVSKVESVSVKKFVKPTLEQLTEYCLERKNSVSPQKFIDHYESNGWKIGGKGAMKDWKAAVRTWESNSFGNGKGGSKPVNVLSTQHSKTLSEKMKEGALRNS